MTIRHPALEKLDALYRMVTGQSIPPMKLGRKSVISSSDPAPDSRFRNPEPDSSTEIDTPEIKEAIRYWMDICETSGTTDQRDRIRPQTQARPQTQRPQPQRQPQRPQPQPQTQTRRSTRFAVTGQISPEVRADIEREMAHVQAKLESEGLGQLLSAARVTFGPIDNYNGNRVMGEFLYTDHININSGLNGIGLRVALFHELGHRFHIRKREQPQQEGEIDRQIKAWFEIAKRDSSFMPSDYARTNHLEFWAECFGYYMMGTLRNERLRAWVKATIVAFRIVTRR